MAVSRVIVRSGAGVGESENDTEGLLPIASKQGSFQDRKLKGDYFLLTGPLMGDPDSPYLIPLIPIP